MRKSTFFLSFMGGLLLLILLAGLHAREGRLRAAPAMQLKKLMVVRWELTDLCLFTEARYTRHPVMADLNTPFQDHPLSIEHYPSGSLLGPPPHLREGSRQR